MPSVEKLGLSIVRFANNHYPPKEWLDYLKTLFSEESCDSLENSKLGTIPLLEIHFSDGRKHTFLVRDVCTGDQLRRFSIVPPDGIWETWADIAPKVLARLIPTECTKRLRLENRDTVPDSWKIVFYTPAS